MNTFIPLTVLTIPNLNPEKPPDTFDYRKLLLDIVTKPANAQTGMDMDEVLASVRIAQILQTCQAPTCEVTPADYKFIVRKIKAVRWQIATPELMQFLLDVVKE